MPGKLETQKSREAFEEFEDLERSDSIYPDQGPVSQAAEDRRVERPREIVATVGVRRPSDALAVLFPAHTKRHRAPGIVFDHGCPADSHAALILRQRQVDLFRRCRCDETDDHRQELRQMHCFRAATRPTTAASAGRRFHSIQSICIASHPSAPF